MSSNRTHNHPASLDNPALAEHANAIRRLGKQTVENVIEIGRHLTEAKAEIKKLGRSWGDWLEAEFQWSDQQARRFMHIFERKSELNKLLNADLPVSALYLLAAPSTPKEARDEIAERAEAGETILVAEAKRVVEDAKRERGEVNGTHAEGAKRKRRNSQEVRLEAFSLAVFRVHCVCTMSAEMEIPPLDKKQSDEAVAQLREARAALIAFGNRFKNDNEKACDDIGPASVGELARKDAEIEQLRNDKRQLEIKIAVLQSEIDELRGKLATGTGGDMSISEFQAAHKQWEEAFEALRGIIAKLENDNANLRAGVAAPPAADGLDIPYYLDRAKTANA